MYNSTSARRKAQMILGQLPVALLPNEFTT